MKNKLCLIVIVFLTFMFLNVNEVSAANVDNVRYDINRFKITNSGGREKISFAGWAVYMEHDGTKINNGKAGEYAPIYHFRFVDNNNLEIDTYEYTANINTGFSITCPLYDRPSGGVACNDGNKYSGLPGLLHYDNVDFDIDNWELEMEVGKSYKFQMKIDIPAEANSLVGAVTSDWFDIKIVGLDTDINGESVHEIEMPTSSSYKYEYETTKKLNFVASNAYKQNENINYSNSSGYAGVGFFDNQEYDIQAIKIDSNYLNQPVKYIYYKIDDYWAYASWIQLSGNTFIITKTNPDCSNPINDAQKKICCETDDSYATNPSNINYCCDSSKSNFSTTTEGLKKCCNSGEYAYKHPGYCCSKYPETCCDAETSMLDGDWLEKYANITPPNTSGIQNLWNTYYPIGSMGRYVCCNTTNTISISPSFTAGTFNLNTFNKNNIAILKNLCGSSSGFSGKTCTAPKNADVNNNTTVNVPIINAGGSYSNTIELDGNISDLSGPLSGDNLAFSFLNVDYTKLKLEVLSYNLSNNGTNYKISITFKLTNITSSSVSRFDMTLNTTICYNKPTSTYSCNNNSYFNSHLAKCCESNPTDSRCVNVPNPTINGSLTCNSENNKIFEKQVGTSTKRLYEITCVETIDYKSNNIEHMKNNIVYSGTGFSYDIDVTDTITCSLTGRNKTSTSMLNSIEVESDLDDMLNSLTSSSGTTGVYIKSDNSSMGEVQYIYETTPSLDSESHGNGNIPYYLNNSYGIPNPTTYSGITSKTRVWKYKLTLPKEYINKSDASLTKIDKSTDPNYILGGNKYYTDVTQATGFNDFVIYSKDAGVSKKVDTQSNKFTCQYLTENIMTTGGEFSSDRNTVATDSEYKYLSRPISLANPFKDTSRLNSATNWKNNNNIDKITTDITDESVYSFNLTASNISNIKKYNKDVGKYNTWNFTNYTNYDNNSRTSNFINCLKNGCTNIDKVDNMTIPDEDSYRKIKQGNFS